VDRVAGEEQCTRQGDGQSDNGRLETEAFHGGSATF
jgi:hypothetical protein